MRDNERISAVRRLRLSRISRYAVVILLLVVVNAILMLRLMSGQDVKTKDSTITPTTVGTPVPTSRTDPVQVHATQTGIATIANARAHGTARALETPAAEIPIQAPSRLGVEAGTSNRPLKLPTLVTDLHNFRVQVLFVNPSVGPWDYGVIFTGRGGNDYSLYVTSAGQWYLIVNGTAEIIGYHSTIDTAINGEENLSQDSRCIKEEGQQGIGRLRCNELKLYVVNNHAMLFINNDWIENIELPDNPGNHSAYTPGDLTLAAAFQPQTQGTSIGILNFKVWSLPDDAQLNASDR